MEKFLNFHSKFENKHQDTNSKLQLRIDNLRVGTYLLFEF